MVVGSAFVGAKRDPRDALAALAIMTRQVLRAYFTGALKCINYTYHSPRAARIHHKIIQLLNYVRGPGQWTGAGGWSGTGQHMHNMIASLRVSNALGRRTMCTYCASQRDRPPPRLDHCHKDIHQAIKHFTHTRTRALGPVRAHHVNTHV